MNQTRQVLTSCHRNADEKIKEAIATGEFDNLPGKGKPLDLNAYFATPENLRMGYSILKSAGIIPEEMKLLKQIEGLKNPWIRARARSTKERFKSNSLRKSQTSI